MPKDTTFLYSYISSVLETTKQETDTYDPWSWVEASVWTNPMLTLLTNGVKGGKWFSLMDKVVAKSNFTSGLATSAEE